MSPSDMGADQEVLDLEERIICRSGFLFKYVKGGTSNLMVFQCLVEGLLVNNRTTADVDKEGAVLHLLELLGGKHTSCLVGQGHMYRNKIGFG